MLYNVTNNATNDVRAETRGNGMINPNKRFEVNGKVISIEPMTSMTVIKIKTKHGIFDYTLFGNQSNVLKEGQELNATIGYSITLNAYTVKSIDHSVLIAA